MLTMTDKPVPFTLVTSGNKIEFLTEAPRWATTESVPGNVIGRTVSCFHSKTISEEPLCVWVEQEDRYSISDGTLTMGAPTARIGDDLNGERVDAANLRKAAAALLNAADLLDSLQQ